VQQPVPPPAPVTCADAGVVLRGTVEDTRKAGPAKEAAIASACLFDKWSREILDCIGAIASADLDRHTAQSSKCLALLSTEQRAALDTKLTAWTTTYENETWMTAEDERVANLPPDVPCTSIITTTNVSSLAPAITQTGEERDFAALLRKTAVLGLCPTWSVEARACIHDGGSLAACRGKLDTTQQQALVAKLAAQEALMTRLAAAKAKPAATYECKAVVAAHYSDAAWRGKAEPPKDPKATRAELTKQAADRKAMIAESRRLMLDACVKEAWSPTLRACELIEDDAVCSQGTGRSYARWGFPALGAAAKTGIPECDAYNLTLHALQLCTQIPQATKDAMRQGYESLVQTLNRNPAAVPQAATSCRQGNDAIKQALAAMGCLP
jgi:hypothetical protein